ncbi:T9SS type A sorting domain-containing protein [Chryseobacterium turcicum]|uniref:T9SS type A sorting domain-containing protein n=1 Tax=Chryseobacterium turcicum TaxID=2898076 RepID=A0A9Q3V4E1_9FLAO|nr:T9SS type A sorting domain-containing protein [Chryseobacterium turcicum]MCD1117051.1 T9SS type A sorting domain-containing protein [Chryseobacterium turcicum]
MQNVVTANSGFFPPVTIADSRGLPTFNAKQLDAIGGVWSSPVDGGNPATAPDVPIDMPFVITYTSATLGTKEVVQYDNRIQVYPNPVKDVFKINNPEKLQIVSVEVMDATGRVVKVLKGSEEYNVSDLPKGSYILKILNNESPKITKLIKQ